MRDFSEVELVRADSPSHTLLPPLFEDAVRTRVSRKFSEALEVFARTPEAGRGALGALLRTHAGVLHMPPQALVVYPLVAVLANALLVALMGWRYWRQ